MILSSENNLLKHIATLIEQENTSGYYPNWNLSFGEYYRSWHLKNENIQLIAQSVLIGNTSGIINEIINGGKIKIHWELYLNEDQMVLLN
jgi:hypothetical protein